MARIILLKTNKNGELESVIDGAFGVKQSQYIEVKLMQGYYVFLAQIDSEDKELNFTISAYSSSLIILKQIQEQKIKQTYSSLISLILTRALQQKEIVSGLEIQKKSYETSQTILLLFILFLLENDGAIYRAQCILYGYAVFFYENHSKSTSLFEKVTVNKIVNAKLYFPENPSNNFEVKVANQSTEIILFSIGHLNNCSHALAVFSVAQLSQEISNDYLINDAITNGKSKEFNGNKNVLVFAYNYNGGKVLVIQNKSNQALTSILNFKQLENLKLIQTPQTKINNKMVEFSCPSGQNCLIKMQIADPSKKISGYQYTT